MAKKPTNTERLRRGHAKVDQLMTEISKARLDAEDAVFALEDREKERASRYQASRPTRS